MNGVHLAMQWQDWLSLFAHYLLLSLLAVGGAVSTTAEMNRLLVGQQHWLTQAQFNASVALGQAAPGPNVLFVALLGWNVGLNNGSQWWGLAGMAVTLLGIMLPSTTLTYCAARWGHRNRQRRSVRAFKQGMAPIVIALLMSTAWVLASGGGLGARLDGLPRWLLALAAALVIWRSRIHMLWLIGAGALLGWFGWV
jgi:chromate transporter